MINLKDKEYLFGKEIKNNIKVNGYKGKNMVLEY